MAPDPTDGPVTDRKHSYELPNEGTFDLVYYIEAKAGAEFVLDEGDAERAYVSEDRTRVAGTVPPGESHRWVFDEILLDVHLTGESTPIVDGNESNLSRYPLPEASDRDWHSDADDALGFHDGREWPPEIDGGHNVTVRSTDGGEDTEGVEVVMKGDIDRVVFTDAATGDDHVLWDDGPVGGVPDDGGDGGDGNEELRQRIDELVEQFEALDAETDELTGTAGELGTEVDGLSEDVAANGEEIDGALSELAELRADVTDPDDDGGAE